MESGKCTDVCVPAESVGAKVPVLHALIDVLAFFPGRIQPRKQKSSVYTVYYTYLTTSVN